jgi:hypothetical protein
MGQQASNNFCEDLVNGSNPRYTYSQQTPTEQVAWQVKKEDEARQAQIAENIRKNEAETRARLSQSYQPPPSTYRPLPQMAPTPSLTSFSSPSTTSTFKPYVSSYDTYSYDVSRNFDRIPSDPIRYDPGPSLLSFSTPSFSTPSFSSASTSYSPSIMNLYN